MVLILVVLAMVAVGFWATRPGPETRHAPASARPVAVATKPLVVAVVTNQAAPPGQGLWPNYAGFQARPFPVASESSNVQWTLADGKDTNIIRQLAHNPLEYDRMVEENPRIFRRQLVYLKTTAASAFETAKLTGDPVRELTLPGVDGQELTVEIVKGNPTGSSRQGMLYGYLAGNRDSLVTLAFEDGREAFTVLAPKEDIFVVGEPREPGQVMVKAINPNTYGLPPPEADDQIKTDNKK